MEPRKRPRRDGDAPPSTAGQADTGAAHYAYDYLPIADALKKTHGAQVCLFAVVSEIGATSRSRGGTGDPFCTLKIADQSSYPAAVSVTFFTKETSELPSVKSSCDVISLHNAKIKMHQDKPCITFDRKYSSFALFEGRVSTGYSPYQTSTTMKYYGSKEDDGILSLMRMFFATKGFVLLCSCCKREQFGCHPPVPRDLELQLRSIEPDTTFDLVSKVLHVREASNGEFILYVWDGTDTPATKFQTSGSLEEAHVLPREVLCTLPCIGTVLPIFSNSRFQENAHRFLEKREGKLHLKKGICWARLCNITCEQKFGMWKGDLLPSSSLVRLLSDNDASVVERLRMYDSRMATKVHKLPMGRLDTATGITSVEYKRAGYSTLMESLTYGKVTHKLKTLVRVVEAVQVTSKHCKHCVQLTLQDPTARIHAYIHEPEMANFLGAPFSEETLARKMKKLLGIPDGADGEGASMGRNPPWIWCCLISYRLDKSDPWGSRRYKVFATRISD